ncbi:group 1 glycosyl transferase [Chondrocystis sp. NIES-4102]|nr:group 1 glycosyl transferase [Chondrocystis sp. NIES-4102]
MKISFVNQPWTDACPPEGGDSTGIWSYQIARYFSANDHDVICYGRQKNNNNDHDRKSSIEYRGISPKLDERLQIIGKIATKLDVKSQLPYFASKWFHYGYGLQVALDAAKNTTDVIHIHNFSHFVPIIRKYNPKAKIIIHLHCEWVNRLNQKAIAPRLDQADLILSCSDYITNRIAARFPQYSYKCKTVNNGVDSNYFAPPSTPRPQSSTDSPQFLFVGRISPEKGVHDLIDAFIQVTQKYPKATLTIIGAHVIVAKKLLFDLQPEPEVQALERYYYLDYLEHVKSLVPAHLAKQIIFKGSLPQEQLLPYYQAADVVINPSLSEAFGMSLVEGMATQTPVIATKIGGMTEIVDDQVNGLLTDPGDPQALAAAMLKIVDNPQFALGMGKAGREKVLQSYSWEQIAENLNSHYAAIEAKFESNVSKKTVTRSLFPAN